MNGFAEAKLGLRLCRCLGFVSARELVEEGLLQTLADLMLNTRCTESCLLILDAIHVLVGQEEFLNAMQNMTLTIENKPEVIYVEEKVTEDKPRKSRERSKDRHRRDKREGSKKSRRSRHKRSKSRSSEKRVVREKKKKVVGNALGEAVEADNEISTLYQLLLSLLIVKQNSLIIKKVKQIIEKINFTDQLKALRKTQDRAALMLTLECIHEYLQESSFLSNELGQLLNSHEFTKVLVNLLVLCLAIQ